MRICARSPRFVCYLLLVLSLFVAGGALADSKPGMVTVMHYFTGEMGRKGINQIFADFQKQDRITVFDNPIGHEDFKDTILAMARGGYQPDIFSYWAGARTQFVADMGKLEPIDDFWNASNLDQIVLPAISNSATRYNGKRYLIPFGYHYVGVFYNPEVIKKAGFREPPKTWSEFLALCSKLKKMGVTPIALGAKNRWPAQFWFDYLLLQTAGVEYRSRLMAGMASYTDREVVKVFELWKELIDEGYFQESPNESEWTDAADKVQAGTAALTLMGTWITGYWNSRGFKAGQDYDFFEFPALKSGSPRIALGPVDGFLFSRTGRNLDQAQQLAYYLIANTKAQVTWAKSQGALSPNRNVDPGIYNSVMRKALKTVSTADHFAFNYDLSTPPPVAEVGLGLFAQFLNSPDQYQEYLGHAQREAAARFRQ